MPTESFNFVGAAGQRLSGLLELPATEPHAAGIFAHCFTCTKSSVAAVRVSRALSKRGLAVLRFDFTGLGQSDGDFADSTFSADVRDVVAAGRALASRLPPVALLIGHSLGGAAVLAAAPDMPSVRAVATIGAPYSAAHIAHLLGSGTEAMQAAGQADVAIGGRTFRLRRSFLEDLTSHDHHSRIHALRRALLVMHSTADEIVGIQNARAIFDAALHPKSFVALHGVDHLLTRAHDADYAADVIAAWASRYLSEPEPARRR